MTASKDAGFTLTDASLSSTDGMTLGLSGITTANLTPRCRRQHLHRQRLDRERNARRGTAETRVTASKGAGFTLTNASLSSTDGMTLTLSGITTANLTDTAGGNTFTVSGWTRTRVADRARHETR